jgi:hypothetical protein
LNATSSLSGLAWGDTHTHCTHFRIDTISGVTCSPCPLPGLHVPRCTHKDPFSREGQSHISHFPSKYTEAQIPPFGECSPF